jgi:hypothetical protein
MASLPQEAVWRFLTVGQSSGGKVDPSDRQAPCQGGRGIWMLFVFVHASSCLCLLKAWADQTQGYKKLQLAHA